MDAVRTAWEAFQEGGEPPVSSVPPAILASWRRSRDLAVPPDLRVSREAAAAAGAARGLAGELFTAAGEAAVCELARDLAGTGCLAVLNDAAGTVLARAGDRDVTARTDAANMCPGAEWTEGAAGTNGIGLALALGRPVQVVAAEHFCAGWQDYGCTTAPVSHPGTGELLGALTLTTPARVHDRPVAAALVRRAAREVEHELRERLSGPVRALAERHLAAAAAGEPCLTVDARGTVLFENEAATRVAPGPVRDAVLALARRALAAPASLAERLAVPGEPLARVSLVRAHDGVAGAVVVVTGPPGADPALRDLEREAILAALQRAGGNVSAAAGALGISRATVYRRLRTYRVLG